MSVLLLTGPFPPMECGVGVCTLTGIAGQAIMPTTQRYIDIRSSVIRAAEELV